MRDPAYDPARLPADDSEFLIEHADALIAGGWYETDPDVCHRVVEIAQRLAVIEQEAR